MFQQKAALGSLGWREHQSQSGPTDRGPAFVTSPIDSVQKMCPVLDCIEERYM